MTLPPVLSIGFVGLAEMLTVSGIVFTVTARVAEPVAMPPVTVTFAVKLPAAGYEQDVEGVALVAVVPFPQSQA